MTFCFTSDFDGAEPQCLRTLYNIYYKNRIPVTLFLGLDDSNFIDIWHDSLHHEVAIHPNFQATADYTYTVSKTHAKWLEAIGVRAHGLLCFSNLFEMYERLGLSYDSSYIMHNCKSEPFLIRNDLVELPIFFEDDVQMALEKPLDIRYLYFHEGIHVFNFHPIHVHNNPEVRQLLEDIIDFAKRNDVQLLTCKEVALKVLGHDKRIETMIKR